MPQMAPIMWVNLFLCLFIIILLVMNFLYFTKITKKSSNSQSKSQTMTQPKNWLW